MQLHFVKKLRKPNNRNYIHEENGNNIHNYSCIHQKSCIVYTVNYYTEAIKQW